MKKIKKSAVAMVISGALLGSGATYAATNVFGNLDQIESDFNTLLDFGRDKKQQVAELQNQLESASGDKTQLEQDIANLQTEIENIKTGHAVEITNKNQEIQNKQDEITAKQQEVNNKQNTINDLTGQLSSLQGEMAQVEARVSDLVNHTGAGVAELTGGE